MNTELIDFISNYCDRWCERCPFTDRCSAFACTIAEGMCGDIAAAIELAVGAPHPVDGAPRETAEEWLPELMNAQPSAEDLAEFDHKETARTNSRQCRSCRPRGTRHVAWDAYFIGVKLHRALRGHDRARHDEDECDADPVQNDWNGSAKVDLISLERSELAWHLIGDTTGDRRASTLGDTAGNLRRIVLDEFPKAMTFVRPGLDEPWR